MRVRLGLVAAVAAMFVGATTATVAAFGLVDDRATPAGFGRPALASLPSNATASGHNADSTPPAPMPSDLSTPLEVSIPRLNVTAPVDPVEEVNGILQVPDDISRVGWWILSRPAGATTGTTVIDGHVDSAQDGLGALFYLTRLQTGDTITVTTVAGRLTYRVYALSVYLKSAGLPADLFTSTGPGRLVVISCGGPFDRAAHSYEDNVAVFASLQG